MQAFQAATAASGSGSSSTAANKSLNAAISSETLPRGVRGVDERAARAAAEVRKKAAARGLIIRPHVPAQAVPPLTQLLNIINSGMTPDATNAVDQESNGHPSNGPGETPQEDGSKPLQQDPTPVGLGSGLTLDPKKNKSKIQSKA